MRNNVLICTAMAITCCSTALAQSSAKATVGAARAVIKKYAPKYTAPIMDELCDKFKKSPEVAVGIADAYLYNQRDTAMAHRYLNIALSINSKYSPAYLLGGEIEESAKDTAKAIGWYERGIHTDPAAPECYLAYAKLISMKDPAKSQRKIEELLTHNPDYPVNLELAKMYERIGDNMEADSEEQKEAYGKSIEFYGKCNLDYIPKAKLESFGIMLYANSKDYVKAIEVAKFGIKKYHPVNGSFNRLAMMANFNLQRWSYVVLFGEALLKSDSTKISLDDYWNLARAYRNTQKYDKAISVSRQLTGNDSISDEKKLPVYLLIAQCRKDMGDWASAKREYESYMQKKGELGTITAYDLSEYAGMYLEQSKELNGEEKLQAYKEADAIYKEMADKFPNNIDFALINRLVINSKIEQGDFDAGLAGPIAEQLISVMLAKAERNTTDNARLVTAYNYMANYYLRKKKSDIKISKAYFQKVLDIDPNDENARKAVTILK